MFNESSIGPSGSGPILSSAASKRARPLCAASRCVKRSEEHTSELQSQSNLVCRLLLEKKKMKEHLAQIFPNLSRERDEAPLLVKSLVDEVLSTYTRYIIGTRGNTPCGVIACSSRCRLL